MQFNKKCKICYKTLKRLVNNAYALSVATLFGIKMSDNILQKPQISAQILRKLFPIV